ncbi:MAG: TIGR02117 family protein, partial [Mesorhizobium sp.]
MRKVWRLLVGLLAAIVLAAALGTLVPRPLWPAAAAGEGSRHILVLSNPIHTDIAIPVDEEVRRRFHFLTDAGIPA